MSDTPVENWSWRIIDTATNEARRFYADGSALAAIGKPHEKTFWDRHPLVERVDNRWVGPDDEVEVRIWIRQQSAPLSPMGGQPARPADLQFSGLWTTDFDFWAAHPDVEYVELRQHFGDDPYDDSWSVLLWLKA